MQVLAGGVFDAGALLETNAHGTARALATGRPVLRALDAARPGAIVWAEFHAGE